MNTILTVVLQISGGLRTEVNSFLSEYAVPVIAMLLIVGGILQFFPIPGADVEVECAQVFLQMRQFCRSRNLCLISSAISNTPPPP